MNSKVDLIMRVTNVCKRASDNLVEDGVRGAPIFVSYVDDPLIPVIAYHVEPTKIVVNVCKAITAGPEKTNEALYDVLAMCGCYRLYHEQMRVYAENHSRRNNRPTPPLYKDHRWKQMRSICARQS